MKALLFLFLLTATSLVGQAADDPKDNSPAEQIRRLLDGLAPQSALTQYQKIVKYPKTARDQAELEFAREQVELAQDRIPKIRALIKPGTSIFAYPGLLAAGSLEYIVLQERPDGTFEHGYQLYLGVFLAAEFTQPWDFHVQFDETGTITAVKSVDWKF